MQLCYITIHGWRMTITLFYKNITLALYSRKGLKLLWFVRQTDGGRQNKLLYWPITSSLDRSILCYLQDPTKHFFCFLVRVAQLEAWYGPQAPARCSQWLQAGSDLVLTDSSWLNNCRGHLRILFHNTHNFCNSSCLFEQVILWLMARSRVNMQQLVFENLF